MDKDLIYEILSAVEEVPFGRVATYGQIARLIGRDKNARLVGKVNGPDRRGPSVKRPPCKGGPVHHRTTLFRPVFFAEYRF